MLLSLHVKNLALIEEEEITFTRGLNILTGETGAGKSIILGALGLALGGKADRELIRDHEKECLVEAVFSVDDAKTEDALKKLEVEPYDNEVIFTRKLSDQHTVARINGETVPAMKMKEAGAIFIDIYGQHEHESLLKKKKHLEMLDEFGKEKILPIRQEVESAFKKYQSLGQEYEEANIDETKRERELSFLMHETEEIQAADLKIAEDEALEEEYHKLQNGRKILESLGEAYHMTGDTEAASDLIGRAVRAVSSVAEYDKKIQDLQDMLSDTDSLLNDFNRELSDYMTDADFDEAHFHEVEERLNLLNELKNKYGNSIEQILEALDEKTARIEKLTRYDTYLSELKQNYDACKEQLQKKSDQLAAIRKKYAESLSEKVRTALLDLNFLDVKFAMDFEKTKQFTANGQDDAQFMISTNPGEPLRPLQEIASGGELSRIMLALKTVLAEKDSVNTLIFDEIDAGISGRTAQAVSEKLYVVAQKQQVICITHLPQIAAMADGHFLIEKAVKDGGTVSGIRPLDNDEMIEELSRMLGGSKITDAVRQNAREMKELAKKIKNK